MWRRHGYEVPDFHGTIGACTCSGYQALLHVREGLGTKLTLRHTLDTPYLLDAPYKLDTLHTPYTLDILYTPYILDTLCTLDTLDTLNTLHIHQMHPISRP